MKKNIFFIVVAVALVGVFALIGVGAGAVIGGDIKVLPSPTPNVAATDISRFGTETAQPQFPQTPQPIMTYSPQGAAVMTPTLSLAHVRVSGGLLRVQINTCGSQYTIDDANKKQVYSGEACGLIELAVAPGYTLHLWGKDYILYEGMDIYTQ